MNSVRGVRCVRGEGRGSGFTQRGGPRIFPDIFPP